MSKSHARRLLAHAAEARIQGNQRRASTSVSRRPARQGWSTRASAGAQVPQMGRSLPMCSAQNFVPPIDLSQIVLWGRTGAGAGEHTTARRARRGGYACREQAWPRNPSGDKGESNIEIRKDSQWQSLPVTGRMSGPARTRGAELCAMRAAAQRQAVRLGLSTIICFRTPRVVRRRVHDFSCLSWCRSTGF